MAKHNVESISDLKNSKYISLREASEISSYTPDYLGQLIRAGKLEGKQVYSNVSWVTTEDALRTYMEDKGKATPSTSSLEGRAPRLAKYFLYVIIGLSVVLLLLFTYVLSVSIDRSLSSAFSGNFNERELNYE